MTLSIDKQVVTNILLQNEGDIVFPEDFSEIGSHKSVSKALERLVDHNILLRVARGIYILPKKDKQLGPLLPSMDDIAQAIARREGARITDSGILALQKLGLSTQIPMNAIYLTDGGRKRIKVGNRYLIFKETTTKVLSLKGEISSLVIKAMKEIGRESLTTDQLKKIKNWILQENRAVVMQDVKKAPIWVRDMLLKMIREA